MNRFRMKFKLRAGVPAIDLSIQKWKEIAWGVGSDTGFGNCALCYVQKETHGGHYRDCVGCPMKEIGDCCTKYDSTYTKYTSNKTRTNAKAMIEALRKAKKYMIMEEYNLVEKEKLDKLKKQLEEKEKKPKSKVKAVKKKKNKKVKK